MSAAADGTVAAVDLGSNSFHMIVARLEDGEPRVLDRLREMVRLAEGVTADNRLTAPVRQRALDCLQRFGQRLRGLPEGAVRVVGTNTLRRIQSDRGFLAAAEAALGHRVEIVSGIEEARLVYSGVVGSLGARDRERRLVMDIGGGSTELIVGEGPEPVHMESLYMGCVSMTRRFFADGRLSRKRLRQAVTAARLELEPVEAAFRRLGWKRAQGASGTIKAVGRVVAAEGWCRDGISAAALERLLVRLEAAGDSERLVLAGLAPDRRPVFAGGVVILHAAFVALGIERMTVSRGALREGLLYDLVGRLRHADVRARAIAACGRRFRVDQDHGERVAATAAVLFDQVAADWELDRAALGPLLDWAARLHEIGLVVSHAQFHKHGAYLLAHADLAGFSLQEQALLAALVRAHRRKFPLAVFEELPTTWQRPARRLALLLRLAVLLHRGRAAVRLPPLRLKADGARLRLVFPPGWLAAHPLTRADLEAERAWVERAGFALAFAD